MKAEHFFLIMSAIYIAPSLAPALRIVFSAVCVIVAIVVMAAG